MMQSFQRVSGSQNLPASLRGGVVAIGNFDGVHRGHQQVLSRALEEAQKRGVPALVLTFDPHPRTVFQPQKPLFTLTPVSMKARLLGELGFSAVVEQPFTRAFAELDAHRFVADILVKDLGISHVVTGFDFHFGKDRQGSPAFLVEAGKRHGFGVTQVEAFRDEGGEIVSSSRIRTLLCEGEVAEAAGLLGYRYTVEAEVTHGKKLGRTLGFPTANMALPSGTMLKHGIYAVRFRGADGTLYDGVANFGRRPTVAEDGAPLLETFLFDFSGDLYWQMCRVSLFGYLRGEEKFESLDALVVQMKRDEAQARALLAGVQPLSRLDRAISFA
ncbi:MAG: bifunctional riboflavin kinase/FAD synthetase [Pseudaminobacter sp.]